MIENYHWVKETKLSHAYTSLELRSGQYIGTGVIQKDYTNSRWPGCLWADGFAVNVRK